MPEVPVGMGALIHVAQVGVTRGGHALLTDVTLSFAPGGVYAILGPSGAGKTTLLRLLNRLQDPTVGTLHFHGQPYAHWPVGTLRQRIAMVFQVPIVFPGCVRDNVLLPLRLHPSPAVAPGVELLLAQAGLPARLLERDAGTLSVGEKQRVCIARALATAPEVLLLDEPTAALDPTAADRLLRALVDLNRQTGVTLIMVSHQPEQARAVGGEVVLLVDGQVAEHASAARFFAGPDTATGRRYLARSLGDAGA